ncbi:hypothetical protein [Priestia sp. J2]|uniref:hypothetical protein n=1 Tax=Priestia sp. J2 TaxID=2886505 RepID=UPI001E40F64F|nr:hypothetical protein [Priestia sp. J2]
MGGGNITARGIMFQTLVSILDSLENEDWDTICVEPKDEEKSDITRTMKDGLKIKRRVTQVKSTENYFDVSKIGDILTDLVSGSKADYYELRLIGNLDSSAHKFIDKLLHKKDFTTKTEKKYDELQKKPIEIDIRIDPLNDEMYDMAIIGYLFKIANSQNINYNFHVFNVCADYLLGNKLKLSVDGKTESKQEYIEKIKNFLSLCKQETKGINQVYFNLIEKARKLCELDNWNSWTNSMIINPPEILYKLYSSTCYFDLEVRQTVWPQELRELEIAIKLFSNRVWLAMDIFVYMSEKDNDKMIAIYPRKRFGKEADESYYRERRAYLDKLKLIQDYLDDATAALNWIVEETVKNLGDKILGSKYFQLGAYHGKNLKEKEKEILKDWEISYDKNSPLFDEIFEREEFTFK